MAIFNTVYWAWGSWPVSKYKYLTYTLDQTQSNPSNMITAISDDAKAMTSQDVITWVWAEPVLLPSWWNMANEIKLNPNNFTRDINGNDVTSSTYSTSYDVMIKFPRRWYKISTSNNITTFSLTDNPNDPEYCYYPFQRITSWTLWSGSETFANASCFYLWAFKGINSSWLRSWYNQTITASQTIWTFAWYARTRGNLYWITEWEQEKYLELLFSAIYKTTNAQSVLWYWYVNSSHSAAVKTGATYDKWMCTWTDTSWNSQMKFLWIEDWYGNIWEWVNWRWQTSNWIYISIPNADGSNRTSSYSYQPSNCSTAQPAISMTSWSYITKVRWDNLCWFMPTTTWWSESTYFTDSARWNSGSRVARFGGKWDSGATCGAFCWGLVGDASAASAIVGARLMYLPNWDLTL